MKEEKFWQLVKWNCPYGLHYAASITCKGYDYFETSTLFEGPAVAKQKLFDKLKSLGHIEVETAPVPFPPPVPSHIK